MPFTRCLCLLVLVMAVSGCRAAQLQNDQDAFRARLQQMQTDQIMDNLIQGYEGFPFVQLDYTRITGTVTQTAESTFNETQTVGRSLVNAQRALQTLYGITFRGVQQNQLTVTADPVVNQPTVYRAYLEFLAKDGRLAVSGEKPPEGAALICRQKCGRWYWVPVKYRDDFKELSLKVVALRGEPIEAPPTFEVRLEEVVDKKQVGPPSKDLAKNVIGQQWELTIKFADKKQVPSVGGSTKFELNGEVYEFSFESGNKGGEVGMKMDRIRSSTFRISDNQRS